MAARRLQGIDAIRAPACCRRYGHSTMPPVTAQIRSWTCRVLLSTPTTMCSPYQSPTYEPPKNLTEADSGNRLAGRVCGIGPAIYIAVFALLGAVAALPLLAGHGAVGFWTVVPGALFGGLVYRIRSRTWPIDPNARARRFGYALAVIVVLPGLIGAVAGLRAQGLGMTLLGLVIGAALAVGILISGDRRPVPPA